MRLCLLTAFVLSTVLVTSCDFFLRENLEIVSVTEIQGTVLPLSDTQKQKIAAIISHAANRWNLKCRAKTTVGTCTDFERGYLRMSYAENDQRIIVAIEEFCGPCIEGSEELSRYLKTVLEAELKDIRVNKKK